MHLSEMTLLLFVCEEKFYKSLIPVYCSNRLIFETWVCHFWILWFVQTDYLLYVFFKYYFSIIVYILWYNCVCLIASYDKNLFLYFLLLMFMLFLKCRWIWCMVLLRFSFSLVSPWSRGLTYSLGLLHSSFLTCTHVKWGGMLCPH